MNFCQNIILVREHTTLCFSPAGLRFVFEKNYVKILSKAKKKVEKETLWGGKNTEYCCLIKLRVTLKNSGMFEQNKKPP